MVADEFILSTKTRNWHWNATDPPFHDLHKFFDVQYEERDAMENLSTQPASTRKTCMANPGTFSKAKTTTEPSLPQSRARQ